MFKLIKYELRKMRTTLLVLLALLAVLEAYFLISAARDSQVDVIVSLSLMFMGFMVVAFAVFIMGIAAYSNELKQKSSYLVFMTPHGTLAVVASKLLFTVVLGVLFAALLVGMLAIDIPMALDYFGEWRGYFFLFDNLMLQQGVNVDAIFLQVILLSLDALFSLLSGVSVAYFAITLSATFLQNRRGRGLVSVLLFLGIMWLLSRVSALLQLQTSNLTGAADVLPAIAPQIALSAAVLVASLFGSAWLLKNRIDL